jgi:hypothetical protein
VRRWQAMLAREVDDPLPVVQEQSIPKHEECPRPLLYDAGEGVIELLCGTHVQ